MEFPCFHQSPLWVALKEKQYCHSAVPLRQANILRYTRNARPPSGRTWALPLACPPPRLPTPPTPSGLLCPWSQLGPFMVCWWPAGSHVAGRHFSLDIVLEQSKNQDGFKLFHRLLDLAIPRSPTPLSHGEGGWAVIHRESLLLLLLRRDSKYPKGDYQLLTLQFPPPKTAAVSHYTHFMPVPGVEPKALCLLSEASTD